MKSEASISKKLNKLPQKEKEIIIENGLRFRILDSELELKRVNSVIRKHEKEFGKSFEELEKVGLPDDADYKMHEKFMDFEALTYDRKELKQRIAALKELYDFE